MLKQNTIHKSLYKPIMFLGCERLPFTALTLICGVIILQFQSLIAIILSFMLYLGGVIIIRKINTEDSQFFRSLYRNIRYFNDYYSANAFYPGRKNKIIEIK